MNFGVDRLREAVADRGLTEYTHGTFAVILLNLLARGYVAIGMGSARITLHRPGSGYVVKVPRYDTRSNEDEYERWRGRRPTTIGRENLAPCRLLRNGCLVMEKLDAERETVDGVNPPAWTSKLCDGRQVGYSARSKRILCYDYEIE